jgi:hypothetical protein
VSVVYRASLKTTRMQAVRDDIDSGPAAATLEIGTSGFSSTLVSITLADPASSVASDTLTFASLPKEGVASATGTAAEARIKESTGTVIVSGLTVGTSGTNIIIAPSTSITSGQTVRFTAGTITHG